MGDGAGGAIIAAISWLSAIASLGLHP